MKTARTAPALWIDIALAAGAAVVGITTVYNLVREWVPVPVPLFASDPDKVWLLLLWVASATVLLLAIAVPPLRESIPLRVVSAAGLVLVVVFLFWHDQPYPATFVGFNPLIAVLAVALAAFLVFVVIPRVRRHRIWLATSTAAITLVAAPALVQTPSTFGYDVNNAYVFSEILAATEGRLSGFDFVSQYQNLLGLPLAPVVALFPALSANPEWLATSWLVLLQLITITLGCVAVISVASPRIRWVIPLIIIPVYYLSGSGVGLLYYAAVPLRVFLPTLLLAVIVLRGRASYGRPTNTARSAAILGLIAGATALNNLDFGVPALLAALGLVVISSRRWREAASSALIFIAGAAVVPIVYVTAGTLARKSFDPAQLVFFIQNFGVSGFMNEPMPVFGLYTAFIFVGVVGMVLGALGTRKLRSRSRVVYQAVLFQSAWLTLSMAYFSGRSLTQTLITGMAFQTAVLLALLFVIAHRQLVAYRGDWRRSGVGTKTAVAAVMLAAVPIAALPELPSPLVEVARVAHGLERPIGADLDYLWPDPTVAVYRIPEKTELIGMLGISGAMWSSRLGIVNANLYSHPFYLDFDGGIDGECTYLAQLPGDALLTTRSYADRLSTSALCSDFDFEQPRSLFRDNSNSDEPVEWVLLSR